MTTAARLRLLQMYSVLSQLAYFLRFRKIKDRVKKIRNLTKEELGDNRAEGTKYYER